MAWRRRSSGTSQTIAIVGAWRSSAVSKPVKVAPTISSLVMVDDEAGGAASALAVEACPGGAIGGYVDRSGVDAGLFGFRQRLADRRDLGVGEGDARGPDAFGDRFGVATEQVLGRYPGLVLAHVGQERPAVDVANGVEPVAPVRSQTVVGFEETVLPWLDPG